MSSYRIYQHPTQGYEAVRIGFSWPGFFFGMIWMLVKKLWGLALAWFGLYFVLGIIRSVTDAAQSEPELQGVMYLLLFGAYVALALVVGFKGNDWRSQNLATRGYSLLETVDAATPDAAVARVAGATKQGATTGPQQQK